MIGRLRVAPQASLWRAGILAMGATVLGLGLASRRGGRPGRQAPPVGRGPDGVL
jgi:hypothetical protein